MTKTDKIMNDYCYNRHDYIITKDLCLSEDGIVYDDEVPIAKFESAINEEVSCDFLIITTQRFKSIKSFERHKKELAISANKAGIPVLFVNNLDIGYGIPVTFYDEKQLKYVAKFSQDDVKTSVAIEDANLVSPIFTYNQKLGYESKYTHAEQVLLNYIEAMNINLLPNSAIYSLLEPCYDCLNRIIDNEVRYIEYYELHKEKWNTTEYMQLTNDIFSGLQTINNKRILYVKNRR